MKSCMLVVVSVLSFGLARAEPTLFAEYDWQNGASDVSESAVLHDGELDSTAAVENGKLVTHDWGGVELGDLPELKGGTEVLLRFEDVTFTELPEGATSQYSVFFGAGEHVWWVGINFDLPPFGNRTSLMFNVGGWSDPEYEFEVVVAEDVVQHFDVIEYRFDGTAAPEARVAIRYDGGDWITGGWSNPDHFRTLPSGDRYRINDGARADWDPMHATLGVVSLYSSLVPEGGQQLPGDCNQDGDLDLSDAVCLLGHLFLGAPEELACGDKTVGSPANVSLLDSNGDAGVNLSDAVHVLRYLFGGAGPPVLGTECVPIALCPMTCEP